MKHHDTGNGKDLYKADNSHVAYLSDIDNGICPTTHPHVLPHLFLEVNYALDQTPDQQPGGRFVFSQGDTTGYGFHGDFQNGWQMDVLQDAVNNCLFNENSNGTIEECTSLAKSDTNAYNFNCPEVKSPIDERVRGLMDKLPGCIQITTGPDAAPNSAMSCPSGVQPPSIIPTQDSRPRATAKPVPGTYYGLPNQQYLGCYNDSAGGIRTLNARSTSNYTAMTPQYCQKWCNDRGYRMSGVEYAQECYCDNFINPTSMNGFAKCNWNCGGTMTKGGRQDLCGGYGYINVYNNTDPNFNATGDNSDSAGLAPVYQPLSPFPENYLGCYSDAGARTLTGKNVQWNNMTVDICQNYCSQGVGFQYYGLEFGNQCKSSNLPPLPATNMLTGLIQAGAATPSPTKAPSSPQPATPQTTPAKSAARAASTRSAAGPTLSASTTTRPTSLPGLPRASAATPAKAASRIRIMADVPCKARACRIRGWTIRSALSFAWARG